MRDIRFHIPLWKSRYGYGEKKRLYLRFEMSNFSTWASGGKDKDGFLKKYRKGLQSRIELSITKGKVKYPTTYDED